MVYFRLTVNRDAKAAKAFLNKAIERVRLHRPVTICTDKAPTYRKVIRDENRRYDPLFNSLPIGLDRLVEACFVGKFGHRKVAGIIPIQSFPAVCWLRHR